MSKLFSVKEAARHYGVSANMLYSQIRNGSLHAIRPRGSVRGWLITEEIMEEWIADGMEKAGVGNG